MNRRLVQTYVPAGVYLGAEVGAGLFVADAPGSVGFDFPGFKISEIGRFFLAQVYLPTAGIIFVFSRARESAGPGAHSRRCEWMSCHRGPSHGQVRVREHCGLETPV